MEKAEDPTQIGNVLQRFRSSFRERKAQLFKLPYLSNFSFNRDRKSASGKLEVYYDNELNESREKKRIGKTEPRVGITSEVFDNINPSLQSAGNGQKTKLPSYQIRRSVSLSSLVAESQFCTNKMTLTCDLNKDITRKSGAELGKINDNIPFLKQESNDSGVQPDFKDLFDAGNGGNKNEETGVDQCFTPAQMEIKKMDNKIVEEYSKNYSIFCEKLSNIQSKANTRSEQNDGRICQSHSSHSMGEKVQIQRMESIVETHRPKARQRLELSLQYFQTSRQLRVILLSVETSVHDNSNIFCKVTLTGNSSPQKEKTHKVRSNSGTAEFNETLYMETEKDDLTGYLLRVQLCTSSKYLKRTRPACEATIALGDIDITFDTTMWVKLRAPKSSDKVTNADDLEITSENRSIHAEVTALLQDSKQFVSRYSTLSRHRSLPQIHRNGILLGRTLTTMYSDPMSKKIKKHVQL